MLLSFQFHSEPNFQKISIPAVLIFDFCKNMNPRLYIFFSW